MKSFKNFLHEELKGLSRPPGRFASNPIGKTDPETGRKTVIGDYPKWVAPTGGREGRAGRESWARDETIAKNNKRIADAKAAALKAVRSGSKPSKERTQISGVDLQPYRRGG